MLTIHYTPGYVFAPDSKITADLLNLLGMPTISLEGTISTASVADGSITRPKLADGALSADTAGRAKMADLFITLAKINTGIFTADVAGRAPFVSGWLSLDLIGAGIFTADVAGRAPFAAGFVNTALILDANVTAAKLDEDATKTLYQYAAAGGTSTAYTMTLAPAPTAYTAGMAIRFKVATGNTGASTVNANALGAKNLKKQGLALIAGNIPAGAIVAAVYDGTDFQITSILRGWDFVSAEQAVQLTAATIAVAHGLGVIPAKLRWVMRCKTGELGYTAGDEIDVPGAGDSNNSGLHQMTGANATNVFLVIRSVNNLQILRYDTQVYATPTAANWKFVCYATL